MSNDIKQIKKEIQRGLSPRGLSPRGLETTSRKKQNPPFVSTPFAVTPDGKQPQVQYPTETVRNTPMTRQTLSTSNSNLSNAIAAVQDDPKALMSDLHLQFEQNRFRGVLNTRYGVYNMEGTLLQLKHFMGLIQKQIGTTPQTRAAQPLARSLAIPQSSNIASMTYIPMVSVMRVAFKSGSTYDYFGVSEDLVEEALQAPSIGKWVNAKMKNGTHPVEKMS